jgi:hypothetical protein
MFAPGGEIETVPKVMASMTQDMQPMTGVVQPVDFVMLDVTSFMFTVTFVMPIFTTGTYVLSARAPMNCASSNPTRR